MLTNNEFALHDFHAGTNYRAYEYFGAHRYEKTVTFRVWAPHADKVYLVGDFNSWDECDEMKKINAEGVYEYSLSPDTFPTGSLYKFKIKSADKILYKSDPFAFYTQRPPENASVFCGDSKHVWSDAQYLKKRSKSISDGIYTKPVNIYEVHLGSLLRKNDGSYINYREAANFLSSYAKKMGYTHIELLPIAEHPFDASWGYQVCNYFAPTSRFGVPDDFRYFVNTLHSLNIGVIIDWVPAHFPKDEHGLFEFDGFPLYEYSESKRQENKTWGTRYFDIGKNEVVSFLISNAVYFAKEFHIDGLRVDAVSSMLYLDYDKSKGEWTPNKYGGNINFEAVAFLKKLNRTMKTLCPDVLMIAEESSAYKHVSTFKNGGLGFDLKWNTGWMNDSLSYITTEHKNRSGVHDKLTFPMMYAFSENYILPISHDEVVYGKKSLLDKMPGDYEDKFAGTRAFLTYMMTQSGKKLAFMSCEYGQFAEWDHSKSIEWFMLGYESHRKLHDFTSSLNRFYLDHRELWECDDSGWDGYQWILCDSSKSSVIAYNRYDKDKNTLTTVINFSLHDYSTYTLEVDAGEYSVVFSTDEDKYGGKNRIKCGDSIFHTQAHNKTKIIFALPSNTALIFKKQNK